MIWGVATAAYQIEGAWNEGGRGPSIWDDFCDKPGRIANGDDGTVADDFYHRYKEDIALMKELGYEYFRMSISWSRVFPDGTRASLNPEGVQFYHTIIDELLANGIKPFVTLFHWDIPSGIAQDLGKDGFLGYASTDYFNDYADFCFAEYGDKVKYWLTFNEIQTYSWIGYGNGAHAPGRCSSYANPDCEWVGGGGDSGTEPYLVAHNSLIAHAKAAKTYREKYQKQ